MHTSQGSRPSRRGGFTLVELAIGTTILVFAVLVAAHGQALSLMLGRDALDRDVAASDLRSAMEEILTRPASEIPELYPPGEPLAAFEQVHLRGERIVPSYPGFEPGGEVPNPLEISVRIEWQGRDRRERALEIETVVVP